MAGTDLLPRLAAISGLLLILSFSSLAWGETQELKVYPDLVDIGTFFRGHGVTVEALIPAADEAIVEVIGPAGDERLMRKGRRGGLWLNVGEIRFHHVPYLYMVRSTDPQLLEAAAATWGYPALRRRVTLSGLVQPGERDEFFEQFLKLKESEGLYRTFHDPLKKSPANGALVPVKGEFRLPTNIKPGTYRVCVSVIREGRVIANQREELVVKMRGFPAMVSKLAYQHCAIYGILAVIIAIAIGYAMGFLFKGVGH